MSRLTLRKRVFNILKRIETSDEIFKVFGEEQKKGHRTYTKFCERLKQEEKLHYEILFEQFRHSKLCAKTLQSLCYSFAVVYQKKTSNEQLQAYCAALMGKYEFGYSKFDNIITQRELKLIDFILDEISFEKINEERATKNFLKQSFTLLVLNSEMKYPQDINDTLELLVDGLENGTASLE